MAKKRKNPKSCPSGKKLVKFKAKGVSFCASKKKKGKGGKRKGRSAAALKKGLSKVCRTGIGANGKKLSADRRQKMKGLCKWAKA